VPAGQPKDSAPSRSVAGKSATLKIPLIFKALPIVIRQAKTTGLVRAANRAGHRQVAPIASMKLQSKLSIKYLYMLIYD